MLNPGILSAVPVQFLESVLTYTTVDCQGIMVVSCHTNGYMYEFKKKKIVGCVDLKEQGLSVSHFCVVENNELTTVYLVHTVSNKLVFIKRGKQYLQIFKAHSNVKKFKVFDFENVGFPQVKIFFSDTETEKIVNFFDIEFNKPLDDTNEKFCDLKSKIITDALFEKLQMINIKLEELKEENNQLSQMCQMLTKSEASTEPKLKLYSTWWKIFDDYFGFGMKICSFCNVNLKNLRVMIELEGLKEYCYRWFSDYEGNLVNSIRFLPREEIIKKGQLVCVVGAFRVPAILFESGISFNFSIVSSDFKKHLLKERIDISFSKIATSTLDLSRGLGVDDLMIIMTIKEERRIEIETPGENNSNLMESILENILGFKKLKNKDINSFYCTSTFLNESLIFLKQVSTNPARWKMRLYMRDDIRFYIFVNALYDHLPEKTTVSQDEANSW